MDKRSLVGPPASGPLWVEGRRDFFVQQVFQGPCHVGRGSTVPTARR